MRTMVAKVCTVCGVDYRVRKALAPTSVYCTRACRNVGAGRKRRLFQVEDFWEQITRGEKCWEWPHARNTATYGVLKINSKNVMAHRHAYETAIGPIPPGMVVCHRCDNPPCVRPDHLFLGSVADNNRDRAKKGRSALGERVGTARLTADQVRAILSDKRTYRAIAAAYGVGKSTIQSIKNGRNWKHVRFPDGAIQSGIPNMLVEVAQ